MRKLTLDAGGGLLEPLFEEALANLGFALVEEAEEGAGLARDGLVVLGKDVERLECSHVESLVVFERVLLQRKLPIS